MRATSLTHYSLNLTVGLVVTLLAITATSAATSKAANAEMRSKGADLPDKYQCLGRLGSKCCSVFSGSESWC